MQQLFQAEKLETYMYITGIEPCRPIVISPDMTLMPASCNMLNKQIAGMFFGAGHHLNISRALALGTFEATKAQVHIQHNSFVDPKQLISTAQWFCIALSAYLESNLMFYFLSDQPLEKASESKRARTVVNNLLPIPTQTCWINENKCCDIEAYAPKILRLTEDERFRMATSAYWSSEFHSHPPMRIATLWTGIEAIFPFKTYKGKKIKDAFTTFCQNTTDEQNLLQEFDTLWQARCTAVHEGKMTYESSLEQTKQLLAFVLKTVIEKGELPKVTSSM